MAPGPGGHGSSRVQTQGAQGRGQPIGTATETIEPGRWVHVHNVEVSDFSLDYASAQQTPPPPDPIRERTFQGYRRADVGAGTRNYVAIISNVNCSATVAKYIARRFDESLLVDYPQVDGVVAFTHGEGCGMEYNGQKHQMLARVLGGIARHPNIGAYLIVGLGCIGQIASQIANSMGAKVSNPLARVHCLSLCCRSRAVTSMPHV